MTEKGFRWMFTCLMALSLLCLEVFSCECFLYKYMFVSESMTSVFQNQCFDQNILHLDWCVHTGLNGGVHAFFYHGCQMVELVLWVYLKHS